MGLLVFAALAVALLVQCVRLAFARGRSKTLKQLWDAVKDAFWGIG
ncbi:MULTISPECIES: hypothetical protein [Pseudoxanthomonas]|uniref:TRAP-type C4-dicarboxylate transport system permease large subunit n=1 Tax=Pseudoxanthomonas winnipegensis TaxID=2480810 RepID=A0AAW8GA52_9GAMM|nr:MULTISPECIES: hypothetical protein [Pseudoxanthomonas]MDQ1117934.1 TRAP-type C4-dicarboxylate transport system permease large subunit [Pseudoxanthomonas winnipegensis]MDQ1134903.1 TRAP-type C4-dicarboxylate transport system permease large subunit [Pseudoxanthomonas winnipegensis]MDR6138864.1 TRAP-type C4-dicarboxylate transport system permease large subunit [Pseudoxanthomonas sp. SORGH_AS_0997]